MKKTLSIALVLMLIAALATPAMAFAAKGGMKGPNPGGRAVGRSAASDTDESQSPPRVKKPKTPKKGAEMGSAVASGSVEATIPVGSGKEKGITNALRHIQTTLNRMQTAMRENLPPGLVRVFQKFFGWLGGAPERTSEFQDTWDSLETSGTPASASPASDSGEDVQEPTGIIGPIDPVADSDAGA